MFKILEKKEKKIVVKSLGGLGNQMFQYAYARYIQELTGLPIYFDISVYNKYKIREFSLKSLNVKVTGYDNKNKLLPFTRVLTMRVYHVAQKILKDFFNFDHFGKFPFFFFSKFGNLFNFDPYYYDISDIVNSNRTQVIYGYFQSEKYFISIQNEIKKELKVTAKLSTSATEFLKKIVNSDNSVAVSIRWGKDYQDHRYLNVTDKEYFYKSMKIIASKLKKVNFFIFSDEPDLVKEEFNFEYPVVFIKNTVDYESLKLMYTCDHFIISNSSFSWFGAYLSDNDSKIVLAPKCWTKRHLKMDDIYTDYMIKV